MVIHLRPTRRGVAVLALAIAAIAMSWYASPRALPAIAVPAVIALAIGVVHLVALERPSVDRTVPGPDHAGVSGAVSLHVDASTATVIRFAERLSPGLSATSPPSVLVDGTATVTYDIERRRRGVHEIGPLRLFARDPLGLVERAYHYEDVDTVTVYPTVRPVEIAEDPTLRPSASMGVARGLRGSFDRLDVYRPGDSLRDIHWSSSAKRPDDDLLVKRYDDDPHPRIVLAIDGPSDRADDLAEAAASLVRALLARDVPVELLAADGSASPDESADGDETGPLTLLSRTRAGRLDRHDRRSATLLVRATGADDPVTVTIDGHEEPFDALIVDPSGGTDGDRPAGDPAPVGPAFDRGVGAVR